MSSLNISIKKANYPPSSHIRHDIIQWLQQNHIIQSQISNSNKKLGCKKQKIKIATNKNKLKILIKNKIVTNGIISL